MSTISIIGSGGMAEAIGHRASRAGHTVEITSRDAAKAHALAQKIGSNAKATEYGQIPNGELVILAVPFSAVLEVVKFYGKKLSGKLIIDITNPVAPDLVSFVIPVESSGAQEIARVAPHDANIVKAFNTLFSHFIASGTSNGRPVDVFIAGDSAEAKKQVAKFISSLELRPMDVGGMVMAKTLEHICLLSLGLMNHELKHTKFSIGIDVFGSARS